MTLYLNATHPGSRGGPGGIERAEGRSNRLTWKFQGFIRFPCLGLVPAFSLQKQEQRQLAQTSFRDLALSCPADVLILAAHLFKFQLQVELVTKMKNSQLRG